MIPLQTVVPHSLITHRCLIENAAQDIGLFEQIHGFIKISA